MVLAHSSTVSLRAPAVVLAALAAAVGWTDDAVRPVRLGQVPEARARAWADSSRVTYRVVLKEPQTQTFEVEIEVRDVSGPHMDFILPTWRPGRYVVLDFAGDVSHVVAYDSEGNELPLAKRDKTPWRVTTRGIERVRLRYQLYANELSKRTRHVDDSHAFLSGSSVFMLVEGRRDVPVRVVVEAPDGWKISSGLDSSPGEPYTLVAPTYDVLIDAPLEIGTHEIHTFEVDGLPFELAIWGRGNYVAETLVADLQKLCSEQIRMWGDAPFSRYVFLLHVTSGAGGGTEHLNSTIMQTSRDSFAPRKKYRRFLGLVAHEFFHTWNVKALRPAGLMPYDYTKENYTPLLWVAEGTTSYYGPLTLVRAGLRKPREYLRELSKSIQSFRERPGRHVQSLDMSSFDAWTKFNKSNAHSPNTTVSFYRKGALVSLLLDLEIRQRTADAASLDDVLRTLYQRFALQGRGYSRADLLATINAVSGSDFSEFFRRFVGGTDELPLEAALDHAGLRIHSKPAKHDRDDEDEDEDEDDDNGEDDDERLSDEKGEVPVKAYVGIALRDSDGLARVSRVMTDGPAYRGGVQADDLIVALDARRLRADDLERRLESYEPGDTIELTLLRRDILKRIRLILVARDDVSLKIETVTDPTAAQIAMYESWLGQPWPKKSRKPTTQPTSDHTP